MIDFIKLRINQYHIQDLLDNPNLDFKALTNLRTRKTDESHKVAKFKGMEIHIRNYSYCELTGSLHKFWNNGDHNFNDFTLANVKEVIVELNQLLNIQVQDCQIHNIEFGVNIVPHIPTKKVLDNLFFHGPTIFKDHAIKNLKGECRKASKQQMELKVYDKKMHYKHICDFSNQLLRYEIRIRKMRYLELGNNVCLSDILLPENLEKIRLILIEQWNKILLYDPTLRVEELDNDKWKFWNNKNQWGLLSAKAKYKNLVQYRKAVAQSSDNIQSKLAESINEKWQLLVEKRDELPIQL